MHPARWRAAAPVALAALVYWLGGWIGSQLLVPGTNVGLCWPPAGLALALALAYGTRIWPGIAVGAAAAVLPHLLRAHAVAPALAIAAGEVAADVVPVLLGVRWIRRSLRGADPTTGVAAMARLALWGGLVAQAVAAAVGVSVLWLGGAVPTVRVPAVAIQWWISNLVSVLVLTPFCLAWCGGEPLRRPLRHVAMYGGTLVAGLVLFAVVEPALGAPLRYPSTLFVIGAAFLLGLRGATAATLLLAATAISVIAAGIAPGTGGTVERRIFILDFYLGTIALVGTTLATLLAERARGAEELAQAQRLESVGRLAGGVAHDLNNLLMPILGYADLLLLSARQGSPEAQDLAELKAAAERARGLTRQLLAFGRRQVLDMRVVDLRAGLERIERLLRRTIREDIRIELRIPAALSAVRADTGQVDQVLMNLAVNAQEAMPRGGVLSLGLADAEVVPGSAAHARGVPAGRWVTLSVSDTGDGMDAEVLRRVFEPFFTTRGTGQGTGLGLSIVHGIVSQHGGHVYAESEPGRGTAFRVFLPPAGGEAAAAPRPPATALRGSEAIVLAEDEEAVRAVAKRMLEGLGYRVVAAGGPAECLRFVEERPDGVDLLVTDVVMPEMNGPQLHRHLAAIRPGLRVVYVSGYAGDALCNRGVLETGAVLLQKPFTQDALGAAVRRALGAPVG